MLRIRKGHVEVYDGRGLHSHHVHWNLNLFSDSPPPPPPSNYFLCLRGRLRRRPRELDT